MTQNRFYSSVAAKTTLVGTINASVTTLAVASVTGFPASLPFTLILERDTANEEVITVTAVSTLTLTVVRAQDGTTGVSHTTGAVVEHGVSARDFNEPQAHIAATGAVHGLSGSIVGTTDVQVLSGKTLISPVIATISNTGTLTLPTNTDTLVGRTTTDTLTNKTLASPAIGTIVNTGTLTLPTSTDTLVGRATTDTLTNKTLTAPTLTTPTLATPTVTGALTGPSWSVSSGGLFAAANYTSDMQTYGPVWGGAYLIGNSTTTGYWARLSNHLIWFYAELIAGSTWSGNITNVTLPVGNISTSTAIGQWHRWSGNNNNIGGLYLGFGASSTVAFRELTSDTNNLDQTITLSNTDHMVVTGSYYAT